MPNTDQTGAWRNPSGFNDAEATNDKRSVRTVSYTHLTLPTNA